MYYTHISSIPVVWIIMIICQKRRFPWVCFELGKTSLCQLSVFVGKDIQFQQHFNLMCPYCRPLLVQTVIFLVLCNSIKPFKRPRLCINERWEAGRGPVFNNIPDIRAAVWIKCTPPPLLLVFIRKHEITLFSPWHHFLPRFMFARHSPCKSKALIYAPFLQRIGH